MLKIILVTIILSVTNAMASGLVLPKCKVNTLSEAKKCIDRVALALPEYEEPNEGMVSNKKEALMDALLAIDVDKRHLKKVQAADYVGAVLLHGDEHEVKYFTFTKGKGIAELCDLNLVDVESSLVHSTKAENFFLGLEEAKDLDAFEDVVYALKEFENNN